MKVSYRVLRRGAVGVAVGLALAACSVSTDQPGGGTGATSTTSGGSAASGVTITYLAPTSWANGPVLKANIAAYEAKSGNKVDLQAVPDEQYDGVVQARLAAGSGIDVFGGQDKVKDPASVMVAMDNGPWVSRLLPAVKAAITNADGHIYGVPAFDPAHTVGFFYNKDVFAKAGITAAPATLAELATDFGKVKAVGATPFYVSGKDGWTLLQHRTGVIANLQGADPDLVKKLDTNAVKWSAVPGFTDEYAAMAGWAKSGYLNSDMLTATYEKAVAAVANGKAGALFNGSWVLGDIKNANAKANIGFFPLPPASGTQFISLYDPSLLKVAKVSKVAQQATDLLTFLADAAQVQKSLDSQPGVSVWSDVHLSEVSPGFADIQKYVDSGNVVRGFDNASALAQPQDDIISSYQQLLGGKMDPQQFASSIDDTWISAAQKAGVAGF